MEEQLFSVDADYRTKLLKEFGFVLKKEDGTEAVDEEEIEMAYRYEYAKTGFPNSKKTYRVAWEVPDLSLEEPYFWFLENIRESFVTIDKLEDSFSAAENSAFFGVTQQRLGAQQDKISQFLATIGKMIKELFQMVRELRIIDERIGYYDEAQKQLSKPIGERSKSGEITLKGMFVDLVQQGAKSAASVFGMARELEFVTLPDLFFDAPPFRSVEELDNHIQSLEKDFNKSVLRVLQRHLMQYMEWRKRTDKEHRDRRRFMLSYLQQHFDIIQMYVNWLKPYLRHTARLTLKEKNMASPDIISSFEGSMLDIELMCRKRDDKAELNGIVLMTYHYRTRPELKVVQEGYQRGPVHIGKFELEMRVYIWTDKQVQNYKDLKKKETLVLMGTISKSVQQAMESLGEELTRYLEEAKKSGAEEHTTQDGHGTKKESHDERKSFAERYFGDFYTPSAHTKDKAHKEKHKVDGDVIKAAQAALSKHALFAAWNTYKNFKKAHKLLAW